jgi:hypothetical protein
MMKLALLVVLSIAPALGACSDDASDPITKITAPRVLAVISEPTVLAVDGDVRIDAFAVDPGGPLGPRNGLPDARAVQAIRMRACTPWKLLADPMRDCAGADALALSPDENGRFAVSTVQLIETFPPPMSNGAPVETLRAALAAGLELSVPVIAEVDIDGETLVARRDIDIAEAVGELKNPRFTELRFDGVATQTLRAGQRYRLTAAFDRPSLDPSRDADDDASALEELNCNFYSPSGVLAEREVDVEKLDVDIPETEPNAYTPDASGPTWIYVVATDETGGMTIGAFPLTIE